MTKFELLICDWAGTTVDFGSFAPVAALEAAFKAKGIEPTIEEIREPMGMLKIDHIRTMLRMVRIAGLWEEKYGHQPGEAEAQEIYDIFNEQILATLQKPEFSKPKPYVVETIQQLRDSGMIIGSTTGYTQEMMDWVVPNAKAQGFGPDFYFTAEDVENHGRPYPYMIFKGMQLKGVMDVRQVVKIGDTIKDIEEGKNAGVVSCGILEGSSEMSLTEDEYHALSAEAQTQLKQNLTARYKQAGADHVFNNFKDFGEFMRS